MIKRRQKEEKRIRTKKHIGDNIMKYYFISYTIKNGFGNALYETEEPFFNKTKCTKDLKSKRSVILYYKEISKEEYDYNIEQNL